jgi:Fe-S-cluster containining protein
MGSLESELERARALDVDDLADAVESVGFECTRCGACCKGETTEDGADEPHTATVFPDEVRELVAATGEEYDWRDVARPMPYGLTEGESGLEGETFEWALQTDACGDCTFYAEDEDGTGACTAHEGRPLICETYPFSVGLGGTSQPMGEAVDEVTLGGSESESDGNGEGENDAENGVRLRAHECEGLGRDIDRETAEGLARALKRRAVRELEEAIRVRESYEPAPDAEGVVVHDSEGAKWPDGTLL